MQVDPIKPKLKLPGTTRLKLKYDKLLSSFTFNFNLCRYTVEGFEPYAQRAVLARVVRRCRLTLSNPRCKRLQLSA